MEENLEVAASVENSVESVDYEKLYTGLSESMKELTAERDSLKSENDALRKRNEQIEADSAKVREMNYTLTRQLDLGTAKNKTPEEVLFEAFLKKGE